MNATRLLSPSEIELWELAKRATPGPWKAWLREDYDPDRFLSYRQHTVIGKDDLGYWSTIGGGGYDHDREDAAFIAEANPFTVSSLLETLEKTRRALAEADDLLIPYAIEYDDNDGPCVFGGSEYHEKDACHACQWHECTAALLSGFSGDASKEEE